MSEDDLEEESETKCIPTTSKRSDSLRNTLSTVADGRNLEKMKLNEPGRQKIGRQAGGQTGRQTARQTDRQADRQTGRWTGRQADRQTDRQTDTGVDRQASR